jgi:hypothetical protein
MIRRENAVSRATDALHDAPESECPHCGRLSKTTSDGICADCWGSKGGRPMLWKPEPTRLAFLDDILEFFKLGSRF